MYIYRYAYIYFLIVTFFLNRLLRYFCSICFLTHRVQTIRSPPVAAPKTDPGDEVHGASDEGRPVRLTGDLFPTRRARVHPNSSISGGGIRARHVTSSTWDCLALVALEQL